MDKVNLFMVGFDIFHLWGEKCPDFLKKYILTSCAMVGFRVFLG